MSMVKAFILAASVLLVANVANADILVFKTGRSMSVQSYRVDGEMGVATLRAEAEAATIEEMLVGDSAEMAALRDMIARVARSSASVMICGASGSGKEVVARAIHAASARWGKPYVALNCGAIPTELIESELFGHERGAFTGAQCRRADTGEHVGGPGTEDGRHHDAAPHGHVRAQPGAWRAQAEHAAAGHVHRRGHGHAVPVDRGRARRAGQRHQRGHVDAQVQPAERHLEHGGVGVVAHEPVGQCRAGSVGDA